VKGSHPCSALGKFSLASILMLCSLAYGQQLASSWQEEVRRSAETKDWTTALRIVDREVARAPNDMDVRSWRARVLLWSGSLAEAEREYHEILAAVPGDPDNWMGLANVYLRQGRTEDGVRALDHAVELDPRRADLRVARARALKTVDRHREARSDFQRALELDPKNAEARGGLNLLQREARHELRVGTDNDWFNFADANHDGGVSLASQWTSHWRTTMAWGAYQRGGTNAEKFTGSLTGKLAKWGALTAGGATASDHGVIPKTEAFFDYDRGWRVGKNGPVRGLEIVYAQHWFWYTTARILTINGTALFYLPKEWMWSLGLTGARSHFSGTNAEWRPSGMTRLAFPLATWNERRLGGNVSFAVGTENFAQVDQIGRFSSRTCGGGLRFQLTARQDVSSFAAYQMRTQGRTETSFGVTYGIRF
jgi:tetratricopeptide (TPR) repeat protein